MRKPTFCICENKDADQLRGNREADQRLCFCYLDSTIPLLPKHKISSLWPSSLAAQPGLCQTCSETTLLVFSCHGSFFVSCRSEISQSQSGTPLPRQVKKLRRESDTGPMSLSQPVKTVSRSERHKRVSAIISGQPGYHIW